MLDHALGRPDPRYRKYQILTVVSLWAAFIYAKPHGPKPIEKLFRVFGRRFTLWQGVVLTCLVEYLRRNFKRLIPWLESPEPLADMYNRDYFRATWITTALDAGFWTAMRVRPKFLRDFASIVFTGYYLICADQADEMVRKVRGRLSLEHLRVSWNKGTSPILSFLAGCMRPRNVTMQYKPRQRLIPRPRDSPYDEPTVAWLYYDSPVGTLKNQDKIILDIPGGGFVAMNPRHHDDKLMAWAVKTGFPVLGLDYKKAPEYPYPYALNECFDVYLSLFQTRGRVIGLPGDRDIKVIVSGDSAGGNLATGLVLKIIQARSDAMESLHILRHSRLLPLPEALLLIYPALDMNISSWLTDEQVSLIKDPTRRKANKGVVRRMTEVYSTIIDTPLPSDDEDDHDGLQMTKIETAEPLPMSPSPTKTSENLDEEHSESNGALPAPNEAITPFPSATRHSTTKVRPLNTRLEMTSMISYVDDRILSPEMLRSMIIMYLGANKRPDFSSEFLLSPLRAPEDLLRQFPKVYMMTGERDPLSDDTVLFAGRLLEAHSHEFQSRKEAGLIPDSEEFDGEKYVHYELVSGVSHGFLQFATVYHRGFELIQKCSTWMKEVFRDPERHTRPSSTNDDAEEMKNWQQRLTLVSRRKQSRGAELSDNEERPLEMSSLSLTQTSSNSQRSAGGQSSTSRRDSSGKGRIRKPAFSGRMSPVAMRKNKSLLTLTAIDGDVLARRMESMVRPLEGDEERPKTPS